MRKLTKRLLLLAPVVFAAACGGNEPQPTMSGMGADALMTNGSLGSGPARGNASKKQPDLGVVATLNGFKPFDQGSAWNKEIDRSSVDPISDKIIKRIGADKPLVVGFGAADKDKKPFGMPYVVVSSDAPRVAMAFADDKMSDAGPYPFPTQIPVEANGEGHAIAIDRDGQKLYETSGTIPDGTGFKATSGAVFDLRGDSKKKPGQTSAQSSGLPIFPGLVRYDEVNDLKTIDHALRFTLLAVSKGYIEPATHSSGGSTDADLAPMGMRLRLKKSFDFSKFPASTQVILKALKKYGMILSETGPDMGLSGSPDTRWTDTDLATLAKLKASDFEVVKMTPIKGLKDDDKTAVTAPGAPAKVTPPVVDPPKDDPKKVNPPIGTF